MSDEHKIFEAIKEGKVTMRPRWYFVVNNVLRAIAIVAILLISVYIASFVIFVLHQDGAWFVPVFGVAGWYALFNDLPWVLIVLALIFIVLLAWLVRRYSSNYQWPLLYSLLALFFLVTAANFVFVQTSFSGELFNSAVPRGLPFFDQYYPEAGAFAPDDVHRGIIVATGTLVGIHGFVMQNDAGMSSNVVVVSDTVLVSFGSTFHVGDLIVVFGDRSATGTIFATGVEKLQD